jgi:putative DNA primase/helicase
MSAVTTDVCTLARLLDGDIAGRAKVLCPGPGHSRRDRSLQVTLTNDDDGFLVHSFAGDDWRDCRDYVRGRLGMRIWQPTERRTRRRVIEQPRRNDNDHLARVIWNEAIDAHSTPVERYLTSRRLVLPPSAEALRFHPACPFGSTRKSAMVALVRNIESNEPQAIHRTALDRTGKMSLGPINRGAIKLTPDEDVTIGLGIAEGIETALSMQRLPEWLGSPVWSVISASGIGKFPLLAGIETLAISADNDGARGAGEKATLEVIERWQKRETFVIEANDDGADLNDVLQGEAS